MVTSEAPERPSSHRHTKCTATHTEVPSEKHPETSQVTPTHQTNDSIPTSKQVGKSETTSHHKPKPQHSTIQSQGNPQFPAFSWRKARAATSSTPTFKAPHLRDGPLNHLVLKANGASVHETHKTGVHESPLCSYPPRSPHRSRQKHSSTRFSLEGFDCVLFWLLVESPDSNQPARAWKWTETLMGLGTPSTTGSH